MCKKCGFLKSFINKNAAVIRFGAILQIIRFNTFETDNFFHLCSMKTYRKSREEYRTLGKGYYHFCTDGWKEGNIFNTIAQYAYGMVLIGLISLKYSIVIYDFTLMPNHIHIIMSGTGEAALEAFGYLKRKLNKMLEADGYRPLPEEYSFRLEPVKDKDQMRALILYIARNHYEKLFAVPGGWPWCSTYLHYSVLGSLLEGKKAKDMSARELARWTGTRADIPGHWQFHPVFGLLPVSFVDQRLVRKLFKGPKDYQTRLVKEYESFVNISRTMGEEIEFDRMEVNEIVGSVLRTEFGGKPLSSLDGIDKGRLCVVMSDKYGLSPESIADALGISVHLVNQFLRAKDFRKYKRPSGQ